MAFSESIIFDTVPGPEAAVIAVVIPIQAPNVVPGRKDVVHEHGEYVIRIPPYRDQAGET